MSAVLLVLYSRDGCCLCEGLEHRLRSLSLHHLTPPLELRVIDIECRAFNDHSSFKHKGFLSALVFLMIVSPHFAEFHRP